MQSYELARHHLRENPFWNKNPYDGCCFRYYRYNVVFNSEKTDADYERKDFFIDQMERETENASKDGQLWMTI